MAGLTLDTGALVALERYRKGMTEVVEAARSAQASIVAPSNAVDEWWRGRTDRREYVCGLFAIKDVDEEIAKLAGEALAWLKKRRRDLDGAAAELTIDATVIATAALCGPNLYTGDFEDMRRFEGFFPAVRLFGLTTR